MAVPPHVDRSTFLANLRLSGLLSAAQLDEVLPRILLVVDEFQRFFDADDAIARFRSCWSAAQTAPRVAYEPGWASRPRFENRRPLSSEGRAAATCWSSARTTRPPARCWRSR